VIIEFVYDKQLILVIILFLLLKNKQETEYDIDGVARSLCDSTPIDNDSTSHSQQWYMNFAERNSQSPVRNMKMYGLGDEI